METASGGDEGEVRGWCGAAEDVEHYGAGGEDGNCVGGVGGHEGEDGEELGFVLGLGWAGFYCVVA